MKSESGFSFAIASQPFGNVNFGLHTCYCELESGWWQGLLVIPSFDVSPHYGDRAAGCSGSSRSILFCLKHNYFHHGDRVQRNLDWASSHGLTHSIVNPLMSTRPNLLFARHAHSAVLKYATQSMT